MAIVPQHRSAWFWALFVLLLLVGLVVAGTGYQHGLPYIDFADEMTIWSMGRAYLDPTWTLFQPQYPPGILVVSAAIQQWQMAASGLRYDAGTTVGIMRLLGVLAYVITLAILTLITRQLGGSAAGLSAGVFWLMLPIANAQAKVATIDSWLMMWFIAAIAVSIEGWRRRSVAWLLAGLILSLLATIFKWQGAATMGVAWLACFTFWPVARRKSLFLLVAFGLIIATFSGWAVFIHRALEGGVYLPGTETSFPTPDRLLINLYHAATQVGGWAIFGVLPLFGLATRFLPVLPGFRHRDHSFALLALALAILGLVGVVSFNGAPVFERQYLAGMTAQAVLGGLGVVLCVRLAARHWGGKALSAAMLIVGCAQGAAMISEVWATNLDYLRPDRRTIFAEWARRTAVDGPLLITEPTVAAALETIYGYLGRPIDTPYNEGTSTFVRPQDITPEMLHSAGIRYVIAPPDFANPALPPLTRLITVAGDDPRYRGDPWAAFWVGEMPLFPPAQVVTFGTSGPGEVAEVIHLRGLWLDRASARPGQAVKMRLAWHAPRPPTRYFSFFLHLSSPQTGELSGPINGRPPVSEDRPTITWTHADELLISPEITWDVPADAPPGRYALWLGLFEPLSVDYLVDYLRSADGAHYAVVGSFEVSAD
jgi:hypothetical protein